MEQKTITKRKIEYKAVTQLRLDPRNPRLPPEAVKFSQTQLLDLMERDFDLLPIARSMTDNGYFDEEPLIVVPKEDEKNTFTVVEGNRRLAALILLTDPIMRARSPNKETYEKLEKSAVERLTDVPVIVHKKREDLIPILGFRHIAGIMKWTPLSKARYIHDLIEGRGGKPDFETFGRELGVRSDVIRRNYLAYRVFLQARSEFGIDTLRLEENFAVFYTALNLVDIQKFIGFSYKYESPAKLKAPIPQNKSSELEELIGYVHGTSQASKVIAESRELRKLGLVLSSPEALKHLRTVRNLNEAYSLTQGEEQSLIESLNKAGINLDEALRYVHRHKNDPEVVRAVERCAESLFEILRHFPQIKQELSGAP